ncbi:MAG TPA: carboxylesterase, partial [Gammaproteobacteria bacterium]|nr:carboxylesterase [Gammaproteobacteria bacterium]
MKKAIGFIVVVALAVAGYQYSQPEEPVFLPKPDSATVRITTSGSLLGYIAASGAYVWQGIRYARAPKGTLRWRAPLPPKAPRKGGIIETLASGSACPQLPSALSAAAEPGSVTIGSEDCLFMDIYSPPNADNAPVMFWLHGGGNTIGQASSYSGENLAMKHGVVVVAINYRLGIFGWFSHPSLTNGNPEDDSGNYGTLDAIRGLHWVQNNIAAFGGNPGNVTVFGESAGAFDTLAMMASPLAEGLFHRAIVQSGGFSATPLEEAQNPLSEGGHPFSSSEILSKLLVADGTISDKAIASEYASDMSRSDIRQYLYRKKPDEFYALFGDAGFGMANVPTIFSDGFVLPKLTTEEIFSSADNHHQVPVILGTNRDEPSLFMFRDPRFVENFLGFLPRLKDEDSYLQAVKYGALSWKERGVDSLARAMTASGNPNVFTYRFDWDEEPSVMGLDLSKALGAAHGLEIAFAFNDFGNGLGTNFIYPGDEPQFALANSMSSYWTEFAITGDPGRGQDGEQVAWLPWGTDGMRSIILDSPADQGIFMDDEEV